MQVKFIHATEEFEALHEPWNQLLARAATNVPFLRHEFQLAWWSHLGGGEWPHAELWIGLGQGQAGLEGITPLFATKSADEGLRLQILGTREIADYLDVIVAPEQADDFVQELLSQLQQAGPTGWEVLDLYNLPEASPTVESFRHGAQAQGWNVEEERLQPCPVISLDDDWEAYLAGLDKKQRHELRRKMRRAVRHPSGSAWRVVEPGDDVQKETERFLALMATDPEKTAFLTPAMRRQFHHITRTASESGWLQLSFLEVGGEPAAGLLNFDYEDKIWVYNSGLDPAHLALSPGWVIMGHAIQWAIENDRREVDFLRGGEEYKYRLGGVDRHISRLAIRR